MVAEAPHHPWYMNAVFYELYIRAFKDTNGDGQGDIPGVIEKLDYIKSLGVDCIWLQPFYPSPLKDDGYDIADFLNIRPDYGTLHDFDRLVEECHRRDIKVIVDLVVNHTSDEHPWFTEARSSRESPLRDWYVWDDTPDRYGEARIIFTDVEPSNWTYDLATGQYYWHRFFASQPDLNYDNPDVAAAILGVMAFWLERGIDGFRVDAVPYLIERDGTNCENLPETHQILKDMRAFLDSRWPQAMMLCEANQPPKEVVEYFGEGDEFHMGFHFPMMPRIFMALKSGDPSRLRRIMEKTPPIPPGTQWATFLRNHDELTLEMINRKERKEMWEWYAPQRRMRRNIGIRRRLAPLLDNNPDKIMLANRVLFSLPGCPIIYYGDEIGMGDNIWLKDRDGVRTPMQWDDTPFAGFTAWDAVSAYYLPTEEGEFSYKKVNVARQKKNPDSLLNRMRELIALRKAHPAFALGTLEFIDVENPPVLAFLRSYQEQTIIVVHNFSPEEVKARLLVEGYEDRTPINILDPSSDGLKVKKRGYKVTLPGYGSQWLLLQG